jgi:hypothetical protein
MSDLRQRKVWTRIKQAKTCLETALQLEHEIEEDSIRKTMEQARARSGGPEMYGLGAHELEHDPLGSKLEKIIERLEEWVD